MSTLSASFRRDVLPKEHGSWSLAFEPVALGLLVAPSAPGVALAVAVAAGFFIRRPLKLASTSLPTDPRRFVSASWTLGFVVVALIALALAVASATDPLVLWPLSLALPFGAAFLWFDLRNDMREAEAEIAGSAAFALLPAAFATLAGWSAPAALALAALMLARSVPTILVVRTFLRSRKGQSVKPANSLVAAIAAFVGVLLLGLRGFVPLGAAALPALLLVRTAVLLAYAKPSWTGRRIGISEAILGALYVAATALAYAIG